MMRPHLIIFDCDGVLVDSEVLSCRCLGEALAGCGIEVGRGETFDLFLGRSLDAVLEHYQGLGRSIPRQFPAELMVKVQETFRSALCPIDGIGSVLDGLKIPHCVASSSTLDRFSLSPSLTGLPRHFRHRLYPAPMGDRGKPPPYLFLRADPS